MYADTANATDIRDSVKYYMRCKYTSCPARKTVRVYVPQFDYVVQMVIDHNHPSDVIPPKGPKAPNAPAQRRMPKQPAARPLQPPEPCMQHHMLQHQAAPVSSAQADMLCHALSAQLAQLQGFPGPSATTAQQVDVLLNMLAVRLEPARLSSHASASTLQHCKVQVHYGKCTAPQLAHSWRCMCFTISLHCRLRPWPSKTAQLRQRCPACCLLQHLC